ncbi:MAG TPA: hypothetical protein V6C95_23375, partial [Coleofasciculaceae cyanobacterium]
DTTSFSVYHQPNQEVSEPDQASAPLLNFGYSKDRRPDLLQYRQMLATIGCQTGTRCQSFTGKS